MKYTEWKEAWRWDKRSYEVKLSDNVARLFNKEGKLLSLSPYILKQDQLNMKQFGIQCIHSLTNKPIEEIKPVYEELYATKQKLWEIYRIPVDLKDEKKFRWIRVRKKATFEATPKPNKMGFYYAEINSLINGNLKMINDDVLELLRDLFFVLECYIGHEEIPFTFSQAWYMDYKIYGDRRYSETIARYNVEQSYYNYIFERVADVFRKYRTEDKASFLHVMELMRKLASENKYYIMNLILNDDHFEIEEDEYVIYYPLPLAKVVLEDVNNVEKT